MFIKNIKNVKIFEKLVHVFVSRKCEYKYLLKKSQDIFIFKLQQK